MRICVRYGATEIDLGVGLNTLANEGSFENSFLSVFEEDFTADVSCRSSLFVCVDGVGSALPCPTLRMRLPWIPRSAYSAALSVYWIAPLCAPFACFPCLVFLTCDL